MAFSFKQIFWGIVFFTVILPPDAHPQSKPGAAGLFTPNTPGNAAALSAQLSGGLAGAPIVDGSGANLAITVPVATPEHTTVYKQFSSSGTAVGVNDRLLPGITTGAAREQPQMMSQPTTDIAAKTSDFAPVATMFGSRLHARVNLSEPAERRVGEVTGSIQYANGETVVFGPNGPLHLGKSRHSLTLKNGQVVPLAQNPGQTMRARANFSPM